MSVLDRAALEDSPLADLHALASELGIDGFRRLRRDALIDAILAQQGSDGAVQTDAAEAEAEAEEAEETEEDEKRPRRAPRRRGGRGRSRRDADEAEAEIEAPEPAQAEPTERIAEGVVELLGNGSGFLRVAPPDPRDDDVYISAAQVRPCGP